MNAPIKVDVTSIDMYYNRYGLEELKKWIDKKIEEGYTYCELEYEWGYYDDLDSVELVAKK